MGHRFRNINAQIRRAGRRGSPAARMAAATRSWRTAIMRIPIPVAERRSTGLLQLAGGPPALLGSPKQEMSWRQKKIRVGTITISHGCQSFSGNKSRARFGAVVEGSDALSLV